MEYVPMDGRVMLRRMPPKEVSEGGIFIPETARTPTFFAEVVAVGGGMRYGVKKGDIVAFGQVPYNDVELDGKPYILIKEKVLEAIVYDL